MTVADERYYLRRVVSWVAYRRSKGETCDQIRAANRKRRQPFKSEWLEAAMEPGCQAVENARLLQAEIKRRRDARARAQAAGEAPPEFPPLRLCDIPGCNLPEIP